MNIQLYNAQKNQCKKNWAKVKRVLKKQEYFGLNIHKKKSGLTTKLKFNRVQKKHTHIDMMN